MHCTYHIARFVSGPLSRRENVAERAGVPFIVLDEKTLLVTWLRVVQPGHQDFWFRNFAEIRCGGTGWLHLPA